MRGLLQELSEESVFKRLTMAFFYDLKELKAYTVFFVTRPSAKKNFKHILKSKERIQFAANNEKLSRNIIEMVFNQHFEMVFGE